jgi:hypothetical protein
VCSASRARSGNGGGDGSDIYAHGARASEFRPPCAGREYFCNRTVMPPSLLRPEGLAEAWMQHPPQYWDDIVNLHQK